MARFHGKRSQYLIQRELVNLLIAGGYLLVLCVFWYFWFVRFYAFYSTPTGFVILGVIFGSLFWYVGKRLNLHERIADQFNRGGKGEGTIFYELIKLPQSYAVFQDVHADYGNIDFAVVGPTGVFSVEVKSHYGSVRLDGAELKVNGHSFEKNFLKQSKGEALYLHNLILSKIGKDYFVQPILVFSSGGADVKFGFNPVEGVIVVQKGYLLKAILESRKATSADDVDALEKIIAPQVAATPTARPL